MSGEVRDEESVAVCAELPEAVDNLQVLHPLDDGILVALLCDVHLTRHAVVEELGPDDGQVVERGVSHGEDLPVMVVHLCAYVEELDNE